MSANVFDKTSDLMYLTEKLRTRESENKDLRKQLGEADRVNGRLVGENESLKAENAKLRELADAVKEFVEDTHCEICPCRHECDDNNHVFCNDFSYRAFAAMRELGIEVGDGDGI